jgi:hypothetical protein
MTEHTMHAKRFIRFFLTGVLFATLTLTLAPPHIAHAATINVGCSVTELGL